MSRLELKDVSTHYGTSHILFDVSLAVDEGEVVCLLGRNGAGKTTTIKTIMGLARASSGSAWPGNQYGGSDSSSGSGSSSSQSRRSCSPPAMAPAYVGGPFAGWVLLGATP